MAKPEFKKGQRVNVFHGCHNTASVTFAEYSVASCGPKQMHLLRADGSNAEFRCRAPFRGDRVYHDVQSADVDPGAHAAKLRQTFAGWIRGHWEHCSRTAEEGLRAGSIGARGYADAVARGKAAFEAATADLAASTRPSPPQGESA